MMERTWKTKIKTPKKTSFLVLIFSMIAPAICKNADLEAMLKTTSLWCQYKCSAAARLPAHTHLIRVSAEDGGGVTIMCLDSEQ